MASSPRVLVYDPHPPVAAAVRDALAGEAWAVEVAVDVEAALAGVLGAQAPDVVLFGLAAGDVDVLHFLHDVREAGRDLPVVVLGDKQDPERIIRMFRFGADDYCARPVDGAELCSRVRVHLGARRRVPKKVGPYRVTGLLGEGGMGQVFEAFDTRNQDRVALKMLVPDLVDDVGFGARFEREIEAVQAVHHHAIVGYRGDGEHRGRRYLVLDVVEGMPLHELAATPHRVLHAAAEVAWGLHALHAAGYVHRDVKPDNIFVSADDTVTLIDLGAAKGVSDRGVTPRGQVLTSPLYASLEQLLGREGPPADQYALGATLFEVLAGAPPFAPGLGPDEILAAKKADPPRLAITLDARLPGVADIVAQMMAKKPRHRFRDLAVAAQALEARAEALWPAAERRASSASS